MSKDWEVVIGLEIHAQLATKSKIFSGSPTTYGADANTQASLVDLGYPGVLPVLNEEVINMAIKFGLAVNADIAPTSVFARKNYFYPDLPKGYQISQYELPIVGSGELYINDDNGDKKRVGITRAHLEEDAGKSIHIGFDGFSGIDLNRAGTPLLEIVSEPDLRSANEAISYMRKIHRLVRYLDISDGNMEEGSFRCDANVSIRLKGEMELGTRTELKNLNSFRFVEKAINYEVERQIDLIEDGNSVSQETRLYDADLNETRSMRSKEEANDYRYFPDPDLLPVNVSASFLDSIRETLPELPDQKFERFINIFNLKEVDAEILIQNKYQADYFEEVLKATDAEPQFVANWVIGDLSANLNKYNLLIQDTPIKAVDLAGLINRVIDNTISGKIAKTIFEAMWNGEGSADQIIEQRNLKQITDHGALDNIIAMVLEKNKSQVEEYKNGKDKLLGFFVGQVMKETGGKANPGQVNEILKIKLSQ